MDAHPLKFSHGTPADAPHILGRELSQDFLYIFRAIHVAPAPEFGVFLAELGGNLRKGLRGGDTDGDGDGGLLPALPGDGLCEGVEVLMLHAGEIQEALVDGIGLYGRRVGPEDLLHPLGHVPVEGEVGAENGNVVGFDEGFEFEVRVTHLDAEGLGFVGACHRAAVVVRQHDDRPTVEFRAEDPFAGGEEVVAIGQGVHVLCFLDDPGDDAPDEEVIVGADGDGVILGVVLVAWKEDGTALVDFHALDGVLSVNETDGLAAIIRLQGAVHDDDVSFVHVGIHHGDTVNLEEEGGGAVAHQELHQV